MIDVPDAALPFGFINGTTSTLASRTIMLDDLRRVLAACPPSAPTADYRHAVVEDNVLLKPTVATRKRSIKHLRALYALDPHVLVFRALRDLWDDDFEARPLLALLAAAARDPVLRGTAGPIIDLPPGAPVTYQQIEQIIDAAFPDRFNATTREAVAQRLASSWQQSGHLAWIIHGRPGRVAKRCQSDSPG